MSLKSLIICILLATALAELGDLVFLEQSQSGTIGEVVAQFAQKQGEIHRKVFTKYIEDKLKLWREQGLSEQAIITKVKALIEGRANLMEEMKRFVEDKLFEKLDMQELVEGLRHDIRQNPENYYLTFEVYDLLID